MMVEMNSVIIVVDAATNRVETKLARFGEDGAIATRTARYCQISQWYQKEGEENRQCGCDEQARTKAIMHQPISRWYRSARERTAAASLRTSKGCARA